MNKDEVFSKLAAYREFDNLAAQACKTYYDAIVGKSGMTIHDVEDLRISHRSIRFRYFDPWDEIEESYVVPLSLLWGEMDIEFEKEKNELYQRNLKLVGIQ